MPITVYYCSVSSSLALKKNQQHIFNVLSSKGIDHESVDITQGDGKQEMRHKVGNPAALAPQIFNGDQYCGDYEKFYQAIENEELNEFLQL